MSRRKGLPRSYGGPESVDAYTHAHLFTKRAFRRSLETQRLRWNSVTKELKKHRIFWGVTSNPKTGSCSFFCRHSKQKVRQRQSWNARRLIIWAAEINETSNSIFGRKNVGNLLPNNEHGIHFFLWHLPALSPSDFFFSLSSFQARVRAGFDFDRCRRNNANARDALDGPRDQD